MKGARCLITLYVFYAEGGLYRETYFISRTIPYNNYREKIKNLVPNNFSRCYGYDFLHYS